MNAIESSRSDLLERLSVMSRDVVSGSEPVIDQESFKPVIQRALAAVSERQLQASEMVKNFELDRSSASLSDVMIEMQKARVTFEALSQVRTKFVSAYQQIMSMPI